MSVKVSNLVKRFGEATAVDGVSFTLDDGRFMALLGPSGSGKTTVLRMLAGLERPDSGTISVQGREVYDGRREIPAEQRDVGMVFQDYALWPHMTVAQNIAFGLRLRRMSRGAVAQRVDEMLDLVHLTGLGGRYPDQLSGGQQQRVAIARALAGCPSVMLLDEPLSNLDAALREEMRVELVRLLKAQGITAVYVTHDRIEALAMADDIVVMCDGAVAQTGTPLDLYARPANTFIAGFLGAANFVPGAIVRDNGACHIQRGDLRLHGVAHRELHDRAVAVLRPEDGSIHARPPGGLAANVLAGELLHSEYLGGRWRHVVAVEPNLMVQVLAAERAPGARVWLQFPPDRCILLPEEA